MGTGSVPREGITHVTPRTYVTLEIPAHGPRCRKRRRTSSIFWINPSAAGMLLSAGPFQHLRRVRIVWIELQCDLEFSRRLVQLPHLHIPLPEALMAV